MKFLIGFMVLAMAFAEDIPAPVTPAPVAPAVSVPPVGGTHVAAPVASVLTVAENVKLASKDWRNYKGCDDTCLSLCVEKPTDFDMKCSVLFSNATLVNSPPAATCRKADVVRDCTYQCLCACKRCGFCKQELVNSCSEDKNLHECLDHVIDQIITAAKCD